jgi:hypothetical protein
LHYSSFRFLPLQGIEHCDCQDALPPRARQWIEDIGAFLFEIAIPSGSVGTLDTSFDKCLASTTLAPNRHLPSVLDLH